MAYIQPFRALRYDPARVKVSDVVTQPYDKITPQMQQHYHDASPYNLVRIILGHSQPGDGDHSNVYTRAADHFRQWRELGIFHQEKEPSIYRYVQRFAPPRGGAPVERRSFIALGRIEDYSAGVVFRHEQTLSKPKADRLNLLRATRAHFGQIFMLYSDRMSEIDSALARESTPEVEVEDEYGVTHQLWPVSEKATVDFVRGKMQDKKLVIADGHHRYETALNYRNERRSAERGEAQEAPYEFVMMTFVNMDSPGLLILPTHRVIHGLASFSAQEFHDRAKQFFSVEEVDADVDDQRANSILRQAGQVGTAFLALTKAGAFLLDRPKVPEAVFSGVSFRQQQLDVVQLHKVLLEHVLGISQEAILNQQNVRYLRDSKESIEEVRTGKADLALLMNPVRIQQVRDIALNGEVLPQKSTDFYPKLLSGLTVYALE